MSESMRFTLEGRDELSRVLNRAGDSAADLQRSMDRAAAGSTASLTQFTRDANGRLRDLNGRFLSTAESARVMGQSVRDGSERGSGGLMGMMRAIGRVGSAAKKALPSLGSVGGGLGAALKGVGVAAGVSALPALGALVPIIVGAGAAAGVAKLAFNGVGDAVALAGEDAEAYKEALDKMSKPQRAFTKELVAAKKEFKSFGKEIQKIVLPSFTKALREAAPAMKAVKGGLREMGESFAHFGDVFGELFGSSQFSRALEQNMSMGAEFFRSLAQPLADFTQGLLDFGAASKPTLKAFSEGIGGLLGKGLPGFFKGLERGIDGSAAMFDGLFDAINRVLPAFGDLVGALTEAVGPALGQIFRSHGETAAKTMHGLADAVVYLKPLFMEVAGAVRVFGDMMGIAMGVAKRVGKVLIETLWPSFADAKKAVGPLQTLADWFDKNQKAVHDFTIMAANAIIDFTATAIGAIPGVIRMFRYMATMFLASVDVIVSGAAMAFGWVPGLGPKLEKANTDFDNFKEGVLSSLHQAEKGAQAFADRIIPKLERNKLKMNISDWKAKIKEAEKLLVNAKGEKKAKLTANIRDWRAKVNAAEKQLTTMKDDKTATLRGNIRDWSRAMSQAKREMRSVPSSKRSHLRATISDLQSKINQAYRELNGIDGYTATTYIRSVYYRANNPRTLARAHGRAQGGLVPAYADGGQLRTFPDGGLIRGPGTSTSDSIMALFSTGPARVSNREYVIKGAAVEHYGVKMFDELNAMRARVRPAPAPAGVAVAAAAPSVTNHTTYNVYPKQVAMTVHDLEVLQLKHDARARVGRPE